MKHTALFYEDMAHQALLLANKANSDAKKALFNQRAQAYATLAHAAAIAEQTRPNNELIDAAKAAFNALRLLQGTTTEVADSDLARTVAGELEIAIANAEETR